MVVQYKTKTKIMKIGKMLENGDIQKEYVELGGCFGTIYKDDHAFETKSKDVCYVAELSDEQYTYQDFVDIAKGALENLNVEGDIEKLAKILFDSCHWQHPETLIDEWITYGEFVDYPLTYGIKS
jgi:hypothetical protein